MIVFKNSFQDDSDSKTLIKSDKILEKYEHWKHDEYKFSVPVSTFIFYTNTFASY